MDKVQISPFLFWFLLECLLHVCLPYADGLYPAGETAGLPGSRQLQTPTAPIGQPKGMFSILQPTMVTTKYTNRPNPKFPESRTDKAIIPRRPGLVHVISVSSISFAIALICGLMISYMIYRLVKAEEKQQLAMLYENVEIPLLDEKEASEDEGQDESSEPHSENEELGKFISSVIRTKRRENILKKQPKGDQNLPKENTSESSNYTEKMDNYYKMEKDEKWGYL
ncbi:2900092C05Rik [Phodopus roborovskii]|uniref:2900092C05Rik protein n=1 Tax=Phodopus roborovskii TaxID=109678 RepID=A0AAV0AC35_PHORO|nr:2900092C05Rik [Phodopus roborovskii]